MSLLGSVRRKKELLAGFLRCFVEFILVLDFRNKHGLLNSRLLGEDKRNSGDEDGPTLAPTDPSVQMDSESDGLRNLNLGLAPRAVRHKAQLQNIL